MGLLDAFLNPQGQNSGSGLAGLLGAVLSPGSMTPEQQRGLSAATARIAELSGPSRTPRTFLQVLGSGMNAFDEGVQSARDRKALEEQRAMQQQLLNWKIKDAEADFGHQQGVRTRDAEIAEEIRKLYAKNGGSPSAPGMGAGGGGGEQAFTGGLSSIPGMSLDPKLGLGGLGSIPSMFNGSGAAPGGRKLSDYDTSFNGTPYSQSEAQAAMAASGGMNGYEPEKLNQVMALARQGMSPEQAGQLVFGRGGQTTQGAPDAAPSSQQSSMAGVDLLKLGFSPTQAMAMMRGGAGRPNMTQQAAERMLAAADIYASKNDFDNAEKRYKAATALMPQVDRIEIATDPETNKPVRVITYKNGHEEVSAFGAKPDMVELDLGATKQFVDKNRMAPGTVYQKTQTPDSRAADARFAARRTGNGGGDASLDEDTLDMMADQALRGDRSVFQNIGRGAQGSANLVALRSRITQKAKERGITGADLASITADYGGQTAGLRTSGNISARIENAAAEAAELAPLAIEASRNVARSGFLPFGKAQVMFDVKTNDPALNKFATANIGLATAYANAMARGQKATVSDMQEARELLSTAKDQPAYEAIVGQMQQEIRAAQRAPQRVREHLRGEISGRGGDHGDAGSGGSPAAKPLITLADIAETARRSGRSTREVTAAFRAKGFKIQGDK